MDQSVTADEPSFEDVQNPDNGDTRYWRDSHQLLTLFPSVVWDHICSFLDSKDFLNLNNSSLFLRELFLQKRVLFLYKPVLELLLPRLKEETEMRCRMGEKGRMIDSLLLNGRAVCKSWKWTIDNKACVWIPDDRSGKDNLVHHVLSRRYRTMQMDKFLGHFKITHSSSVNPFVGRYINLFLQLEKPDFPEISNQLSHLLEKYGKHIWTFDIRFNYGVINPREFHYKFVNWLKCMPNLQNLSISGLFRLRPDMIQDQHEFVPTKLKFLRKLAIKTNCLSQLDDNIPDWSWIERYNLSNLITQHDNLEYLRVTTLNNSDVGILVRFNSPLKRLIMDCNWRENESTIAEVCTILSEKFSGTLENLSVYFHVNGKPSGNIQVIRDTFNGRLNLPKVRKLEISILGVFCVDFVLGMKDSLEEVIFHYRGVGIFGYTDFTDAEREEVEAIESNQVVKFMGYQNRMMESNIWDLFPKLDRILMKDDGMDLEFKRGGGRRLLYQL